MRVLVVVDVKILKAVWTVSRLVSKCGLCRPRRVV